MPIVVREFVYSTDRAEKTKNAAFMDCLSIQGRFFNQKIIEMRKPECREGKEKNESMRKINRTAPTAISVKRRVSAG